MNSDCLYISSEAEIQSRDLIIVGRLCSIKQKWKEAVVVCFTELSLQFPEGSVGNHRNVSQNNASPGHDSNLICPEFEATVVAKVSRAFACCFLFFEICRWFVGFTVYRNTRPQREARATVLQKILSEFLIPGFILAPHTLQSRQEIWKGNQIVTSVFSFSSFCNRLHILF
jgi:hypothetical protein